MGTQLLTDLPSGPGAMGQAPPLDPYFSHQVEGEICSRGLGATILPWDQRPFRVTMPGPLLCGEARALGGEEDLDLCRVPGSLRMRDASHEKSKGPAALQAACNHHCQMVITRPRAL